MTGNYIFQDVSVVLCTCTSVSTCITQCKVDLSKEGQILTKEKL